MEKKYPELTLCVVTGENEADRIKRYQPAREYFEKTLGVKIIWRTASDYAGVIEGVRSKKVHLAMFGPASYAECWLLTKGQVTPLAGVLDANRNFGYYSVIIVKADSPYQKIEDLKGKKVAWADPNSTSGFQAPVYFLSEQGIDPEKYFGSTSFSGSHENSVIALMHGSFDAVATSYNDEIKSNPQRMADKGMIPQKSWRVIWKSPLLPSSPWAVPDYLPEDLKASIKKMLLDMPEKDPEAFKALTDGKDTGYREVSHDDYKAIVRMIEDNLKKRKQR